MKKKNELGFERIEKSPLRGKGNSEFHANKTLWPVEHLLIKVITDVVLFSPRQPERVKRKSQQERGTSRLKFSQS